MPDADGEMKPPERGDWLSTRALGSEMRREGTARGSP
jgi:hypothetical protein